MTIRLTIPQLHMLKAVRDAGPGGYRFSLNSATLGALKVRGYVATAITSASQGNMDVLWIVTPDGADLLSRMGK
jgi:hypothetical protein